MYQNSNNTQRHKTGASQQDKRKISESKHKKIDMAEILANAIKFIVANKKLLIAGAAILLVLILIICLSSSGCHRNKTLSGIYVYDQYIRYEFDGHGDGCMYIGNARYEYTYDVSGNALVIDFASESMQDASYTFDNDGNKLTLYGAEGTSGGTYELEKVQ